MIKKSILIRLARHSKYKNTILLDCFITSTVGIIVENTKTATKIFNKEELSCKNSLNIKPVVLQSSSLISGNQWSIKSNIF